MNKEELVKNLLTELIDFIDNGSQRDLDRADEIAKTILEIMKEALENQKTLQEELEDIKADLENLSKNKWNKQVGADKGLELAIDVVENRISELKGENK